ncbi:hemolysin family protein [Ligilactobacillus equi]|uniref:Hemolysin n=1 Tax=Ligilactobacillus equi DPC 6820 TaxID=1392007 RepID=V7HYI1_9LACO|nr:hemolysin family protein [Ligilactobacillus equi]ETA74340.1 hemolysin [Ligilactobacillus equi DPC 6820]
MQSDIVQLVIIILILGIATIFTLAEYSLVKVRPTELQAMEQTKNVVAAQKLVEKLTEYLSTAQVGITLTSLILGWIGEEYITELILESHLLPHAIASKVAPVIGILIFTFLHAVFTDLVPKNIAIDKPVVVLLAIVRPLQIFHIIFYPLVWLFDRAAIFFTKLLGFNATPAEDIYSQSEIISLSQDAAEAGELDKEDLIYMKRAFDMNDKVAEDIMIDRTQLTVIDSKATVAEAAEMYFQTKYSRFPVVEDGDKDRIVGYIYSYEIMKRMQNNPQTPVRQILRMIPYVYEGQASVEILRMMIKEQVPIVVVQDEFGGTAGIITDKDIYEELFGSVRDETDHVSADQVTKNEDGSYDVLGKITLYDFERYFNVELPEFDDSEAVTLNGFIMEQYHDHLEVDQAYQVGKFTITPLDFESAHVDKFRVTY